METPELSWEDAKTVGGIIGKGLLALWHGGHPIILTFLVILGINRLHGALQGIFYYKWAFDGLVWLVKVVAWIIWKIILFPVRKPIEMALKALWRSIRPRFRRAIYRAFCTERDVFCDFYRVVMNCRPWAKHRRHRPTRRAEALEAEVPVAFEAEPPSRLDPVLASILAMGSKTATTSTSN